MPLCKTGLQSRVCGGYPDVMARRELSPRDHDIHKGAMEEDRPGPDRPAAPGLDQNGLPNDATAIAQDALGAIVDESQG